MTNLAWSNDSILHEIGESLRFFSIDSVPNLIFASIVLSEEGFDGGFSTSFSESRLLCENKGGVIFAIFCNESLLQILKKIITGEKCQNSHLLDDLLKFFVEGNHIQYIRSIKKTESEAEIQSVLAHHLFAPLVPKSTYTIDKRHKHLKNCFACKEKNNIGDTSLGHPDVWHGWPDISIEKSTVTVKIGNVEDIEQLTTEEEESECLQILNNSLSIETKKHRNINSNAGVPECIAQTITNAFYVVNKNPHLENYYIPSFLATETSVNIAMYNCKTDRLFMSEDLSFFDDKTGKVNVATFTIIWLVLNFERFFKPVPDEVFKEMHMPTSSFPVLVGKAFPIYLNELSNPLVNSDNKRTVKRKYKIAPEMYSLDIKYFKNITEEFQEIENLIKLKQGDGDI